MSRSGTVAQGDQAGRVALRLIPLVIFLVLTGLTVLVWHQQVLHQRRLLARHVEDVCVQAARRLEIRLESRLRVARIFALRWSTHEARDFSRQRFDEFAGLLVRELPAYHAIRLIRPGGEDWLVPPDAGSAWDAAGQRALIARADREELALSETVRGPGDRPAFFAALALRRGTEPLGHLIVEFGGRSLISELFHRRIRSEFNLRVTEGARPLFLDTGDPGVSFDSALAYSASFATRGRVFTLTVVPHREQLAGAGWAASWPIPLFGLLLSVGLSLLTHLLSHRMEAARVARDQALREIERRERAQRALRTSEARYHSVFESATDGLVVLDGDDRVVEANPAAAAMHGWELDGFVGRSYQEFIAPGHKHLYREFKRQLAEFGSVRLDSVHVRRGGGTLDVEVRGAPFSYGGEPRLLAILTDVSDRKLAVQRHAMLSRKVLMAQEEERARVSRELHDELGQILTALRLELDWLRKRASGEGGAAGAFENAVGMVERAADELRRICRGLRPPLLDDLGLEPAARLLVDEFVERTRINVDLQVQLNEAEKRVPPEVALGTYRILQESLNNVARHADAREVSITLSERDGELVLSVYDDGGGFLVNDIRSVKGVGIAGMRERASLLGGTIDIRSEPHQGTRVTFRMEPEVAEVLSNAGDDGTGDAGSVEQDVTSDVKPDGSDEVIG